MEEVEGTVVAPVLIILDLHDQDYDLHRGKEDEDDREDEDWTAFDAADSMV